LVCPVVKLPFATMTRSMIVILVLAAQSMSSSAAFVRVNAKQAETAESNLRAQSNSSMMLTFSHSIFNNTITNLMQNEVEMVKANPPKVNKVAYVVLAMLFGLCGCDRCFMGQICLGCLKGFTGGGFIIWHLIDYFVALVSALTEAKEINTMGYHATFEKDSVKGAMWVAVFLLIMHVFQQVKGIQGSFAQRQLQQQQQDELLAAMVAARSAQVGSRLAQEGAARSAPGGGKEAASEDGSKEAASEESLDIPKRHQSLAYMPTMFTKGLRKAGIVTEKPTIPELIAAFDKMDANGDGQLDHDEIREGMKAMGATDEAIDEMIKSADTDGDGKISKNEFLISYHTKEQ